MIFYVEVTYDFDMNKTVPGLSIFEIDPASAMKGIKYTRTTFVHKLCYWGTYIKKKIRIEYLIGL